MSVEVHGPGAPRPATPRRPGSAGRDSLEVRWFVPGDVAGRLRPRFESYEVGGVPASIERWVKRRLRERDLDQPLHGAWFQVDKQLWRIGGIEVCRLEIGTQPWWTVAITPGRYGKTTRRVFESWAPLLRSVGEPTSYPVWVLARSNEHAERLGHRIAVDGRAMR